MGNENNKLYHCIVCDFVFWSDANKWMSRDDFETLSLQRSYVPLNSEFDTPYIEGVYNEDCLREYLIEIRKVLGINSSINKGELPVKMRRTMEIALSNGLNGKRCPGKKSLGNFLLENSNLHSHSGNSNIDERRYK